MLLGTTTIAYVTLLLAEIFGIILIFWEGIPIFRHLVQFERIATGRDHTVLLIAAVLVQFSYWTCLRYDPPFAVPRQQFFGHVLLFVSRLVFIFASTFFSLVVYRYSDVFDLSPMRVLLMMAVLFSVFCFTRHLEKLGTLMNMAGVLSRKI